MLFYSFKTLEQYCAVVSTGMTTKRRTVETRCNESLYNEDPCITNHILQPRISKMYGKEPRYNEPPDITNTFPSPLVLRYIGVPLKYKSDTR